MVPDICGIRRHHIICRYDIKPYDQIIAVDGIPLDDPDSNRDICLQALKNKHMRIELYLARDKVTTHLTPSKEHGHIRNRSDVGGTQEVIFIFIPPVNIFSCDYNICNISYTITNCLR